MLASWLGRMPLFLYGRLVTDEALFFDVLEQLFICEQPLELFTAPAGELVQPLHEPLPILVAIRFFYRVAFFGHRGLAQRPVGEPSHAEGAPRRVGTHRSDSHER
jgi:hypothetical protein